MNFLQLVNRTKSEAGISGHGLVTVEGQTGEMARLIDWVRTAYVEIQNMQPWNWLWQPLAHVLTLGKSVYSPTVDFGVQPLDWRPDRFYLYEPGKGRGSRWRVPRLDWRLFDAQTPEPRPGVPLVLAIKPNRDIAFSALPDRALVFEGEFRYTPEVLIENTDTPSMPEQYHMAIVWKAVMLYAQYEEATTLYQLAGAQLGQYIGQMVNSELDGEFSTGALA